VVDCDRVAAWVWDDKGECLRCLATVGHSREQAEAVRSMTIAPSDTPYLARMLTEPQPLFIDNGTDDQFLHGLLVKQELAALTVVPLVARGQFLGLIAVSVAERPERLHAGAELLEKLTGVAALAATGIQNGRLIDELGHKATHDGLTGVLNRAGFGQQIQTVLDWARGAERHVGLLFVDLDDFKGINDEHGHGAGDELLRQATDRLAGIVRRGDAVARLGGDEFAVILDDVSQETEVMAAADRARGAFARPFALAGREVSVSASIGHAIWPDGGSTVDALIREADAAMYREKAAHGRLVS
jgi:diguanylate cyclase (GGDEF)-like protein